MRRFARAALGAAMFALVVLIALVMLLPHWLASDGMRARIADASEAALGRRLGYEQLDLQWSPPAFVMVAPVISGATFDALPLLQAARAIWNVAPQSWLTRDPWIDRLRVEGATLRLEDDEVAPAVVWELRELAASLRRDSREAPVYIEASFEFAGGGHGVANGSVTLAGESDLGVTLEGVSLAHLAPYLDSGARLAGAVSGTLALTGPLRHPSRVTAQLELSGGDVQLDDVSLRGPLRVELELGGSRGERNGNFAVDATDAELAVGRGYRKLRGIAATVDGRIVSGIGGAVGVDEVKLHVGDRGGPRSR